MSFGAQIAFNCPDRKLQNLSWSLDTLAFAPCIPHWLPWMLLLSYPPKIPSRGCILFQPQLTSKHASQKDFS